MLDTAVIDLGLLPHIFWDMTMVDFYRYLIYIQKEEAKKWEHTRYLASFLLNTQVSKKHQQKPKDLVPLWTDKLEKRKVKKVDYQSILDAYNKRYE